MNKYMIDALPRLLKRLSGGESLHIPTLNKELNVPESTVQDQIKRYIQTIEIVETMQTFYFINIELNFIFFKWGRY